MKKLCFALVFLATQLHGQFVQYSEAEQRRFALERLKPIVEMVMYAKLPYPEVNRRVRKQDTLIKKRFGDRKIALYLRPSYHQFSRFIPAASGIVNGELRIVLYVSAIMSNYVDNQAHWIRCVMHERDHLTEMSGNASHINLELETHMHALTTKFVTVPMKEKYGVTLSKNDQRHYDAWVKGGRSEKSPIWRDYVKSLFSLVLP